MRQLRNLTRRKLRTALTVSGIAIGIWALVVFSSMANKIQTTVDGGSEYFAGKVVVTDASDDTGTAAVGMAAAPMSVTLADDIAEIDGVGLAIPRISIMLDPEAGMAMGNAEMLLAAPPTDSTYEAFIVGYSEGRALTEADADQYVTVLGSDLALRYEKGVGDEMEIRGRTFEVVGVQEATLSPADTTALVPLAPGQEMFVESIPALLREQLGTSAVASQILVYPAAGEDTESLAERIEAEVGAVHAMTVDKFRNEIEASVTLFNAIIIGVALISLVVGGLSVINTMAMSVQERTREIGIKRAIGGSRATVVRELVTEAALIGLIGGLIGLGLGALVVAVSNEAGRASATVLFELTVGTSLFALGFSTILGMVAGVIPAWNAARLDPVQALRHE